MSNKIICFVGLLFVLLASTVVAYCNTSSPLSADGTAPVFTYESLHGAVDWYREAAEKNAIYSEIFKMALSKIKHKVKKEHLEKGTWGIILDIDETIVDNRDLDYEFYLDQETFDPVLQNEFIEEGNGYPEPGVVNFIKNIHNAGGYVSIVTNRSKDTSGYNMMQATEKQLQNIGLKKGEDYDQILLWDPSIDKPGPDGQSPDKNSRFDAIITGTPPSTLPSQHVVAWFGDNICDFPYSYQGQNTHDINKLGDKYFCLPNPMYGSWTNVPEPPPLPPEQVR